MEIITGRTGTDHVYAADDAELYRMFIGSGDYVFRTGNQFNATMYGAYTIRVSDGSLMTQGRLAKIRPSDGFDELQFEVGVAGYKRADLVVAEYRKTVTTHEEEIEVGGVPTIVEVTDEFEDVSLVVVKGANNANTYIAPTYATGDIDRGEVHQVPLWEVRFNGVNFDSLIDRRIFLDGVPYDTLIAHSQAVYEQANARADDALVQLESALDKIKTATAIAPLTVLTARNVEAIKGSHTEAGVTTHVLLVRFVDPVYTFSADDIFVLYLNGLRIMNDDIFRVSDKHDASHDYIDVELYRDKGYDYDTTYDEVQLEVWRPKTN